MKSKDLYKSEIEIPENISVEKKKDSLIFNGPLGSTKINLLKLDQQGLAAISIDQRGLYKQTTVQKKIVLIGSTLSFFNSLEGLIIDKINGVCRGFLVYLRVVGIGYRASLVNNSLLLKLGFSHEVKYHIPTSIRIFLIEPTLICIFGLDKNQVTQIAAKIRQIKPPSPYKGKGIRLIDEKVLIKQGKQK